VKKMSKLKPRGQNRYLLPREGAMLVDALIYLNDRLRMDLHDDGAEFKQLCDAASLPGVINPVIGMPDIHSGFGLPIGGVMACQADDGVVSAGGVGMDINCGVRLLSTVLDASSLDKPTLRALMAAVENKVPAGIGRKSRHQNICRDHIPGVLKNGAAELIAHGLGRKKDLERIEENGCLPGADSNAVSKKAMSRVAQLSTLGGGNHFIEFGLVEKVYDQEKANLFGLFQGKLTVMIHTGSRGFGHQICTDYTEIMARAAPGHGIKLPSRGLACAPIHSRDGQNYLAAMACAVNFAFANRQLITHDVREAFSEVLDANDRQIGLDVVYDVAHNIAKFEKHGGKKLLIHRKGATRALPPGHPQNPTLYRETGHPAIIPGSMNSPSYVIVGTGAISETFCSVNHGAGRVLSRSAARKSIDDHTFLASLGNVMINTRNYKQVFDESPLAYKNIDDVIDTLFNIGLTQKVVRIKPLAVIKGEGDD
jgi:tRNA-splicing ligase RtcB (3'-phosphate/5'-hydroxy nucleic acid ligase)